MTKSLYIGNVEFILEADIEIQLADYLKRYFNPLMTIDRTVLCHIKYENYPKPMQMQLLTNIAYPPHIVGKTESGECRIYQDIIDRSLKAMYCEVSPQEVKMTFYGECPEKCIISFDELNYFAIERQMMKAGSLILHSSFIEVNGKAILFTAPSGTGKSTQADLWKEFRGARVLNGDRTLLVRTKEGFKAAGFPFSGSSGIFENKILPISAIVMIRQAERCSGKKEDIVQSFKRIYPEITRNYWDTEYEDTVIKVLNDLLLEVQTISLDCTMGEDTVECLEKILKGEIIDENC